MSIKDVIPKGLVLFAHASDIFFDNNKFYLYDYSENKKNIELLDNKLTVYKNNFKKIDDEFGVFPNNKYFPIICDDTQPSQLNPDYVEWKDNKSFSLKDKFTYLIQFRLVNYSDADLKLRFYIYGFNKFNPIKEVPKDKTKENTEDYMSKHSFLYPTDENNHFIEFDLNKMIFNKASDKLKDNFDDLITLALIYDGNYKFTIERVYDKNSHLTTQQSHEFDLLTINEFKKYENSRMRFKLSDTKINSSIYINELLMYNRILSNDELIYLGNLKDHNSFYYRITKTRNELEEVNCEYTKYYTFPKINKADYKFNTYRTDRERFFINKLYNNTGTTKNFGKDMLVFTLEDFERFSRNNFNIDVIVDGCYIDEVINDVYHQYEVEYNLASARVYIDQSLINDYSTVEFAVRKTRASRNLVYKIVNKDDNQLPIIEDCQVYKIDKHKLDKPFYNINEEITVVLKRKDEPYRKPLHNNIHYKTQNSAYGWNIDVIFFITLNEGDEIWISSKDCYENYTISSSDVDDMNTYKMIIDTTKFINNGSNPYELKPETTYSSKISLFNLVYPLVFKENLLKGSEDIGFIRHKDEVIPYFANWTNEYRIKMNNHFMTVDDFFVMNLSHLKEVPPIIYFGKNLIQNKKMEVEKLNFSYNKEINYSLVFDKINKYGIINISELRLPASTKYLEVIINGRKIPQCDIEVITYDIIRIHNLVSNVKVRVRAVLQDSEGIMDILDYYRRYWKGNSWENNSWSNIEDDGSKSTDQLIKDNTPWESFEDWLDDYVKDNNLTEEVIDEKDNESPFFTEDKLIDEDKFNELEWEEIFGNGGYNDIDANLNYQEFHKDFHVNSNFEFTYTDKDTVVDANNEGYISI